MLKLFSLPFVTSQLGLNILWSRSGWWSRSRIRPVHKPCLTFILLRPKRRRCAHNGISSLYWLRSKCIFVFKCHSSSIQIARICLPYCWCPPLLILREVPRRIIFELIASVVAIVWEVLLFELLTVGAASHVSFILSDKVVLFMSWSWRGTIVNWRSCHSRQGIRRGYHLFKLCLWICRRSWIARGSRLHLLLWGETAVSILRAAYSLCVRLVLITWNDTHSVFWSLLLLIEGWGWRAPFIVQSRSAFYRAWIVCIIVVYWLFSVVIVMQWSKLLVLIINFDRWPALISIDVIRIASWLAQNFSLVLTRQGRFRLNLLSAIVNWFFVRFQLYEIGQPLVSVGQFDVVRGFKLICLGWGKVGCGRSPNWTRLFVSLQDPLGWWIRGRVFLLRVKAHILLLRSCVLRLALIFIFLITVLLGISYRLLNVKLLSVLFFIELNSINRNFWLCRIWSVKAFFSWSSGVLSRIIVILTQRNTLFALLVGFRNLFSFQSERVLSFIVNKRWTIFLVVTEFLRKPRTNLVCHISSWLLSLFELVIIDPWIVAFWFRSVFINKIFPSTVSVRLQSLFLLGIIVIRSIFSFKLLI